tara:strand:+ start:40 stop:477 length:438 start_codon:yes stop_codon:yes gene_type:complete
MLNSKFLNISLKTWIMIILTILYLIFKKKREKFTELNNNSRGRHVFEISNDKIKAYNFNTSWCGFSKDFQPNWNTFSKNNNDSNVDIIDVKCDDDSNQDSKRLCQKYPVRGYPTILFVKGENVAEYSGDRTPKDIEIALQNFKKN